MYGSKRNLPNLGILEDGNDGPTTIDRHDSNGRTNDAKLVAVRQTVPFPLGEEVLVRGPLLSHILYQAATPFE
jgi:hypothetical protein